MYKNLLICWMFGRINLTAKQIQEILSKIPEEEKKEDWIKIIEGGDLENHSASVAEVALDDFMVENIIFLATLDFRNW